MFIYISYLLPDNFKFTDKSTVVSEGSTNFYLYFCTFLIVEHNNV